MKQQAKQRAAAKIHALTGVKVSPNALFDIQVGHACVWCYVPVWGRAPVPVSTGIDKCPLMCVHEWTSQLTDERR